jgi:hypothetical protein
MQARQQAGLQNRYRRNGTDDTENKVCGALRRGIGGLKDADSHSIFSRDGVSGGVAGGCDW